MRAPMKLIVGQRELKGKDEGFRGTGWFGVTRGHLITMCLSPGGSLRGVSCVLVSREAG
jgi:hypothetical protein